VPADDTSAAPSPLRGPRLSRNRQLDHALRGVQISSYVTAVTVKRVPLGRAGHDHGLSNRSGSFATLAAIRRAWSLRLFDLDQCAISWAKIPK